MSTQEQTRRGRRSAAGPETDASVEPVTTGRGRRRRWYEAPETGATPAPASSEEATAKPARRRHWWEPPAAAPDRAEGLTPFNARGTKVRVKNGRATRGFYAPMLRGAPSTTRQAEVLNTAVIAPPEELDAPLLFDDMLSRAGVHHDVSLAYAHKPRYITSLNVVVVGDIGTGKSTCLKVGYIVRPFMLRDRSFVVFDKKGAAAEDDDAEEGEYASLVRAMGTEPVTFSTGDRGVHLNLLDPLIAGVDATSQGSVMFPLLRAVTELAQDGKRLTQWETEALRSAYRVVRRRHETGEIARTPVLPDVLHALGDVEAEPLRYGQGRLLDNSRDELHMAGASVRFLLEGLVEENAGLFDGETSSSVKLDGRLTSFDLSQLPDDGPVISMVMAISNMWLLGALTRRGAGRGQTTALIEEGWHVMNGPTARLLNSNTRLSRRLNLSYVLATHKIADIPPDSEGMSLLREAQTVHIFGQSRASDAERCVTEFNLDPTAAALISNLAPHTHLFKRGKAPEQLVRMNLTRLERELTDTDQAIRRATR